MFNYIIRRLLLMIPTFLGITLIFFLILQLAPGGPVERQLAQMRFAQGGEISNNSGNNGSETISPKALAQLNKFYGFDKPIYQRYLLWLGIWPREINDKTLLPGEAFRLKIRYEEFNGQRFELQKWIKVTEENGKMAFYESAMGGDFAFDTYVELPDSSSINNWYPAKGWRYKELDDGTVSVYQLKFSGILQGNLGKSYVYQRPVKTIIGERIHISAYFGLISFFLAYLISIPLGITKAVKHGSGIDTISSILVFIGYSIPGFALGLLLLMFFASPTFFGWLPLGSFRSLNYEELSTGGKILDQLTHTILPIIAWTIGQFATLTILMKNSLMENLGQDYIRTAFSKGMSEKRAIYVHALRNSLIPIVSRIGLIFTVVVASSILIERTFNINGIGLLSINALVNRDYPISLGFMVITTVLALIGNLVSDIILATVDPRIRFN